MLGLASACRDRSAVPAPAVSTAVEFPAFPGPATAPAATGHPASRHHSGICAARPKDGHQYNPGPPLKGRLKGPVWLQKQPPGHASAASVGKMLTYEKAYALIITAMLLGRAD